MTARDYFDPAAGDWIAWYSEPGPGGKSRRVYLMGKRLGQWSSYNVQAKYAARFDTKTEALAAVREAKPGRLPDGYRKGASRAVDEATE